MRTMPVGILDTHVHLAPDVTERVYDDDAFARLARAAGYAGFVIKCHVEGTASRAKLVRKRAWPNGAIFGGVVLNHSVGGLSPATVESQLRLGARIVWMPTTSAAAHVQHPVDFGLKSPSQAAIGLGEEDFQDGSALSWICALIADADAVLATGHLSPAETLRLVPFARSRGVERILITHPELPALALTRQHERELAHHDGVWFERCAVVLRPEIGVDIAKVAGRIRLTGCERTILASDGGHPINEPLEGMRLLLDGLAGCGFREDELELMAVRNPVAALGVDPVTG